VFAAFLHRSPDYGNGVYFTTNGGTSWTKVGLDSINISQLVSYGDTTYALTQGRGVFKITRGPAVFVSEQGSSPTSFILSQNYPNPFNPSTTIRYSLPKTGHMTLKLYNLLGQEVETLVNGEQTAGAHTIEWKPRSVASGVYFYRLVAGSFVETKKMLLQK
jgi:hypothetical protein